ncbi:MAG: enoyl-CoA hydratase/isomerase family protein [Chloroflexi bacterium]|nr:enoyl-CoA hydratase/isomerase family protein [Chloroflexota bacterium]
MRTGSLRTPAVPSPAPPLVRFEREGDIAFVTLDRPERLNAVSMAMRDALWGVLTALRDDPTVRCAVFTGAGDRAFSAGADITEFGSAPGLIDARAARQQRDLWGVMSTLPVPLIAAIHGFAYGAGCEMSMYCDLRVASEDARFALPEVTLGYIPSAGGTQTIPRHAPRSEALRMVTSGEPLSAAEALRVGLVHSVVRRDDLMPTARVWAERIAAADPLATRAAKRAILEGIDLPLADGLALERRLSDAVRRT